MALNRRRFIKISALSSLGFLLLGNKAHAQDVVLRPLRDDLFLFVKSGGTILIHQTKNSLVIVDTQFEPNVAGFPAHFNLSDHHQIDFLINTHHHGDHTGGNQVLGKFAKKMVAHQRVPELLTQIAQESGKKPGLIPTTTFSDTWSTEIGSEKIYAFHFGAAHTGGDAAIYFEKENVAHLGDLCFNYLHPVVDRKAGASITNWQQVLQKTMEQLPKDCLYVFGHAGNGHDITGSTSEENHFNNYLSVVMEEAEQAIKKGISKEDLQKTKSLRGFEEIKDMGKMLSLSTVLGHAYDELTEMKK